MLSCFVYTTFMHWCFFSWFAYCIVSFLFPFSLLPLFPHSPINECLNPKKIHGCLSTWCPVNINLSHTCTWLASHSVALCAGQQPRAAPTSSCVNSSSWQKACRRAWLHSNPRLVQVALQQDPSAPSQSLGPSPRFVWHVLTPAPPCISVCYKFSNTSGWSFVNIHLFLLHETWHCWNPALHSTHACLLQLLYFHIQFFDPLLSLQVSKNVFFHYQHSRFFLIPCFMHQWEDVS